MALIGPKARCARRCLKVHRHHVLGSLTEIVRNRGSPEGLSVALEKAVSHLVNCFVHWLCCAVSGKQLMRDQSVLAMIGGLAVLRARLLRNALAGRRRLHNPLSRMALHKPKKLIRSGTLHLLLLALLHNYLALRRLVAPAAQHNGLLLLHQAGRVDRRGTTDVRRRRSSTVW